MKRTNRPKIAGILNIIFGFILGAASFGGCMNVINAGKTEDFWMLFLLIPGIISFVGGIHALSRKKWGLALAGSILAIPVGIGILSTIFVVLSREEFE